jgi:AcrR family transcriptional regulator
MGRPRRISDADIAREARAVFLAEGPAASTQTIAKRLGVSQAALFKRVPTKNALMLLALAPRDTTGTLRALPTGPEEALPVAEQLVSLIAAMLGFFRELQPGLLTLRAHGIAGDQLFTEGGLPPQLKARDHLTTWLKLASRQGRVRSDGLHTVATLLLGAIESRCLLEYLNGSVSEDPSFAGELVAAAWRGLAPD